MTNILKVEDILKNKYLPALKNQIGTEPSPFLEKVKKVPLCNNTIKGAAPIGLNGGFGFGYEGSATPVSGGQLYEQFTLDAVDMYVDIRISDKTVKLASSNASSMINALNQEVKSSYETAKWNLGRALFGNGSGVLAKVTGSGEAVNTVTVDDTKLIREGLTVDFYKTGETASYAKKRIISVDRANKTITFDGAAVNVSDGFITVQNSYNREIVGLGAIFDDSITSLYGITKSNAPWIKPVVIDCKNDLNDIVLSTAVKDCYDYKNSVIDLIMMGDNAFKAYTQYMKENNVVIADKHKFVGGATGFSVLCGNTEAVIINERFVPSDEVWGVDTSAFKLESTDWAFASKDGGIFNLMPDTSVYRALLACYGNLMCENPGGCFKITNCSASAE